MAASQLPSSLVTFGSAGTLTAICLCTSRVLISPRNRSPRRFPLLSGTRAATSAGSCIWGLIPHWAADPSIGNRMINARAETLTELPSVKPLVDRRRCIIPADGFYEWRKEGKRKSRCGLISRAGSRSGWLACGTCGASRMGSGWSHHHHHD